ncbi:MAG: hypothetical protein CME31_22000 [Gimesia sp.]|jgi:hypothetical protein|uniref:Uncharacterized protein n=1 Tax=Gimesia maris TaxID=122 RepID=A0A3D3R9Q6_9PLAN|nr:hypothetical protein [Gimesia sp.]HCO25591.1 hypothetical protein [Gimesia maris]|tara:strand:+ start:140848 stop:141543 length:696 start_codon:yes stop_codon:yes gene_type:complete
MNLVDFQTRLETMIETRDFDQRSRLEQLSTSTPEHQRLWEDFLILETAVPAWQQKLPEIDLVEEVLTQLEAAPISAVGKSHVQEIPRTRSRARQWSASLFVVTVLLIAITVKFSGNQIEKVVPGTMPVITEVASDSPVPVVLQPQPHRSFNQLLKNAGAASWGLAQSTAGTMTEAVSLVPVTDPLPETTEPLVRESNWVDDINLEMQPIKDQISHAWNFIIHSVPEDSTKI